jgi:hypothetical protein
MGRRNARSVNCGRTGQGVVRTVGEAMRTSSATYCVALAVAAFAATPAAAQVDARTLTLAGVSDCLSQALAKNAVEDEGGAISFSCTDAKARTLYNFLGKKIHTEVIQDRNGKFENRAFGNSACYHRIEDQSGNTADEFRCDLILAIGEALGE